MLLRLKHLGVDLRRLFWLREGQILVLAWIFKYVEKAACLGGADAAVQKRLETVPHFCAVRVRLPTPSRLLYLCAHDEFVPAFGHVGRIAPVL